MRWAIPKSLNGILSLGLAAVAAPLLFAILYATIEMSRLASFSESLVIESVQTTRLSQDMFGQIASLERAARLYQILHSPQVLTTYQEHDELLTTSVRNLRIKATSPTVQAAIAALVQSQQRAHEQILQAAAGRADSNPADSGIAAANGSIEFATLGDQAARIAELINQNIDGELASLRSQTNTARTRLFWEATLLVPLLLFAVLAFSLGLGRPLRQIDRAIAELGAGNFSNAIAVSGTIDLERLGAQLEWLRSRLLDLAQERNRFLRHMSHELKTPLANIREGTELLMDGAVGELDSGQREVTTILQDNGIKLQRLIENLLSFSSWQNHSMRLELSEFRLRPLIKQVLENQQLTLVAQRARLDVHVDELLLTADRGKLRLILENLLSNAIKYSPRGGVIHLFARQDRDHWELEVADDGVGVPAEERAHIFEAFYTGRAPSGHVKGTGIGLSVVNEFVNVHQGSIEIVDGRFTGAHFRVRLPMQVQDDNVSVAGDLPPAPRSKAHAA